MTDTFDRPRWLSDRLATVLGLSIVLSAALVALGIAEPWMLVAGPGILLATNRLTARAASGSWASRYDDPDPEGVEDA
jgi:hypothetical protein